MGSSLYVTQLVEGLAGLGAVVYDPGGAFVATAPQDANPYAQGVNEEALRAADAVLGWMPDGVPSIGVPIEIARAAAMGKPLVVLGGKHAQGSTVLASLGVEVVSSSGPREAVEALAAKVAQARSVPPVGGEFLDAVREEVARARAKHPASDDETWTTADRWFAIWTEEVLELIAAAMRATMRWNDGHGPEHMSTEDVKAVREELVQTAAMTLRLWASLPKEES
jgi:hypothetical protein